MSLAFALRAAINGSTGSSATLVHAGARFDRAGSPEVASGDRACQGVQLPLAYSRGDQCAERAVSDALPAQKAQTRRYFRAMRDLGEAGGAEVGACELKVGGLPDVEIAAGDEHAALGEVQHAADDAGAPGWP